MRRRTAFFGVLALMLTVAGLAGAQDQGQDQKPAQPQEQRQSQTPAQPMPLVERSARGPAAKDIQIGVYLNVQADCSSGTLPTLRLVTPPANGSVNIKQGKIRATNYKQCLALEVPGFIAFYKSKPDFNGVDTVTIEVKYPNGRTEVQRISVTIGGATPAGGRNI